MNFDIQRERLPSIWDEALPLFKSHYDEIAMYKDVPLAPSFRMYEIMEKAGYLRTYTARSEGKLVGYFIAQLIYSPHYSTTLFGIEDVIFVLSDYRKSGMGVKLLEFGEKALAAEGAKVIVHHVKESAPLLGEILKRRGFDLMDHVYTKRI